MSSGGTTANRLQGLPFGSFMGHPIPQQPQMQQSNPFGGYGGMSQQNNFGNQLASFLQQFQQRQPQMQQPMGNAYAYGQQPQFQPMGNANAYAYGQSQQPQMMQPWAPRIPYSQMLSQSQPQQPPPNNGGMMYAGGSQRWNESQPWPGAQTPVQPPRLDSRSLYEQQNGIFPRNDVMNQGLGSLVIAD